MNCPYCGAEDSKVISTVRDSQESIRRRRECKVCLFRFTTHERIALSTPMLIKQDGNREQFDREKLIKGISMACAKRPVPAVSITRLADYIESTLQQMGVDEVPSRTVGDMVVSGLRELDEIAYIRFALIYYRLSNISSVRCEIDKLLAAHEAVRQ